MSAGAHDPTAAWRRHLDRACERVAAAPAGERNGTLHKEAHTVGGAAGWPGASRSEALDALVAAALAAGLPATEARAVVRRSFDAGARRPLAPPAGLSHATPYRRPPPPRAEPQTAPAPRRAEPPARLELGEVTRFLWGCAPVTEDAEAVAYLAGRGLDAVELASAPPLAFVLRPVAECPLWARLGGRSWAESGHRLIVPLYNADGVCAGVRARSWTPGESKSKVSPIGQNAAGLVLADWTGRAMLAGSRAVREVWIAEGESDFWTLALADLGELLEGRRVKRSAAERGRSDVAVLGIVAGAWPDDDAGAAIARRVPATARVMLAVDEDGAGSAYAAAVANSLDRRGVACERVAPPQWPGAKKRSDWNEWWTAPARRTQQGAA